MTRAHTFGLHRSGLAIVASLCLVFCLSLPVSANQIEAFVGEYTGSADITAADGTVSRRDMSVSISETKDGFTVNWTSTSYRPGGKTKEKSYSIRFVPSARDNVFSAAMRRNVFGHDVQMDPMKGEPFVWSRIEGNTLTVFSLFVDETGGYEMQQYDRTLADGGLQLDFKFLQNGAEQRSVSTFLERQ